MQPFHKPLLPQCFLTWTEPPDASGDEVLRIVSRRRSLTLKGHSFREFARSVLPLLDGATSFDAICTATAELFDRADLEAALAMLGAQGIVIEGDSPHGPGIARLAPQTNYLSETALEGPAAQRRLGASKVIVFGLGGAGAALARSLGAAGIGRILCVDPYEVGPTDLYFSALFSVADLGRSRAETVAARVAAAAPEIQVAGISLRPDDPTAIGELLQDADLVLCCLESGELNAILRLNRACRAAGVRWLAGALEGTEIIAGPGFPPTGEGPCYMCYRMRQVACAANPESRFALEQRLDRIRQDLGNRRENLACGADLLAGLLGTEALNLLAGIADPTLDGRVAIFDLPSLGCERHTVLRKPGCPVCGTEVCA